jgi:hypothetical protein
LDGLEIKRERNITDQFTSGKMTECQKRNQFDTDTNKQTHFGSDTDVSKAARTDADKSKERNYNLSPQLVFYGYGLRPLKLVYAPQPHRRIFLQKILYLLFSLLAVCAVGTFPHLSIPA